MSEENRIRSIHELDLTITNPVYPSPSDWRDQFIYFLLIDRFNDGGADTPPYTGVRGATPHDGKVGVPFQGGTLAGITQRLDYIRELGATTIWLSPVLKNRPEPSGSFHGYATQDFFAIDPRIGTKDDLRTVVREAHQRGMYVILDIVINHTGDNWYYKDDVHPVYDHQGTQYPFGGFRADHAVDAYTPDDAVWPVELQSPECYKRRGAIVNWNDMDESINGDFMNLKELDLGNPLVLDTMKAVYKYWIKETDIDGFRIDTVKHIEDGATASFCNAIKEYTESIGKKNFFLFGEIVSDDETLRRYVGPRSQGGDQLQALDAVLDFPLYFVLEEVIKGFAHPQVLRERYDRLKRLYADTDASEYFVTFLDNHDQMARPFRRFLHGGADPLQAVLGIGYLLTTPGIPAIYYGTEQGFDGGGDPGPWNDVRIRETMFGGAWGAFDTTGMQFFNTEHPIYTALRRIAHVRAEEPALRYGRMYFREVSDTGVQFGFPTLGWGMLAYSRILDTTELLVVLNLKNSEQTQLITVDWPLSPPGTLVTNMLRESDDVLVEERVHRAVVQVTLGPHEIAIYKKKESK
jgi:glycosidase